VEHRSRIIEVATLFDQVADHVVFCGSCVLALYGRPAAPSHIRPTRDVDCICTITPYAVLSSLLAGMCEKSLLTPDPELACRYVVCATGTVVDVIDLEGRAIGTRDPWVQRAAEHAVRYPVQEGLLVSAVAPQYFLAMKLAALLDRGPDEMSTDAEDIVTLALEVEEIASRVLEAGLAEEIRELMSRVQTRYDLSSWSDLVDYHLDPAEADQAGRVRSALAHLSGASDPTAGSSSPSAF
jgi:hypothetical protein